MTAARDGRIITFYSYKGGTGRTMALANTAWILAAGGKRVLTVDWDLEAPGLHRFFHPFLDQQVLGATSGVIDIITEYCWQAITGGPRDGAWHHEAARVEPHVVSLRPEKLGWRFPKNATLDFLSAGRQNREYSASVSSFEWDNFYERLGGGLFLDALRADMKATYDYVLIDSRTGLSDNADICTIHMPDVLVDCFTLSDQALDGAAAIARSVEAGYRGRPIRVLPVPMRIDEGEKEKVDAGRALARMKFDGLPRGLSGEELTTYWGAVEIPYRPYYAYEETLATVGDEPGLANSLLSSFERLTAVLTDGEINGLVPVPEQVRLRCRDAYIRRRPQAAAVEVTLVYVAENRMWADWIESALTRANCRVTLRDLSTDTEPGVPETLPGAHTLVLLSPSFLKSRRAEAVWRSLLLSGGHGGHELLHPLRVEDARLTTSYLERNPVDLHRVDEAQCLAALLRCVDLPVQVPDGTGPRFPGKIPAIWNAPPRNVTFTGRDLVLDGLRDQLSAGMSAVLPQPQALYGLGGVGKTQVAIEYVHRFLADYDLVWWISAEDTDNVVASLADLAARLGIPVDDISLACTEALRMLGAGRPTDRWLLVFDNADDPERITPYFPHQGAGGTGHILVTSRNQAWTQLGASLGVDVFLREESVEHLTRRAQGLSPAEADQVAAALGDLPLAVEQAAAWLAETATPVEEYLAQLAAQTTDVLKLMADAPGYPKSVAATWNISIARLRERSPASVRLLELCAFLAPEPISNQLLYSREMIEALKPYDPTLQEKLVLGRVIREIGRFALAKIDQVGNSIQVHRLVQAVIRSQLSEDAQREARHVVHTVLAGARPDDDEPIDDPGNWPRFDLIWPHLGASDARHCSEPETRRLLIDRVRYLWKRGDFERAHVLAEDLLADWRDLLDENDVQYLYLRGQLANIQRSQGRYVEARDIDKALLAVQRDVLGDSHPHTYVTTSSLASDLAALGAYESAVELAREAHTGFSQIFHESHPRTLSAANNLALALRMVGRYGEARALDQDILDRRMEVLGPEHPYTLASAAALGRDLREVGRYGDSVTLLSRTYESHKRLLGKAFPGTLACAKSLAVSLRRDGQFEDARRLTTATRGEYRSQFSVHTPDTLACDLNLAADLFAADERAEALQVAEAALAEYMKVPGENHPYTQAALNNLGIFHWGCGDPERAAEVLARAHRRMGEVLGTRHPHTLFCGVNYANALADMDRLSEVHELEAEAADTLGEILGHHHPETLAVRTNHALTLGALGRKDESHRLREESLEELRVLLGEHNGLVRVAADQRRVYRDLEPLAV
ncbi:FxSxx-COOH system tetratricopeptide repeat protein [Streptomyces sp. VRA16 Mangrove soil]|uniref:FxSxx-COOH system tetratricopeptide repeat protein n=1 Tax=Streptomyces sp. VRA16 Mangrove soil TaxID=2817434 RepID=UPI001A9CC5FF|nr:FxSxx-COOH system tetratricopeptide repeat protein [Streptomyces sp. VRA16 Mangrove soil]MBO1335093.1 tetratricopeptide repeat protein [Streptomyces sp. VRA16 Mangrove soil]